MPYLPAKNHFIKIAAVACFILRATLLNGQVYHKTALLTTQQGLSDNRITCIFKDRTGYLWIGTRSGLNRYDGHDFTVFNPGSGNSISNEIINGITEDKSGKLWVATMNGLNCYDPVKNQWRNYFAMGGIENKTIPNPIVWSCFTDATDRIWITTDRNGPSALEKDRASFTHSQWRQFVYEKRPDLRGKYFSVIKMIPVAGDEVYLGSTIGIFKFNKRSGLFTWLGEANRFDILDMQYDAANRKLYMTTGGREVYLYDEQKNSCRLLQPQPLPYPSGNFSEVMSHPAMAGFPDGLVIAGKNADQLVLMKQHPDIPSSIPGGGVNTVYQDNTGIVWIGTNKGLAQYNRNHQYTSFLPLINMQDRPSANPMGAVYFDTSSGSYFVCSVETAEVFIINRARGTITTKKTDATGKQFGSCLAVKEDREKQLWLLTASHVYRYNRTTGQFVLFPTPNGNGEAMFRDMVQDAAGNYWLAGFHSPLYYFDRHKKAFTFPGDTAMFNGISKVNSLLYDSVSHSVWAGTFNHGLYRFDMERKKFTLFTESPAARQYSFLNLVNHLYQDNNGKLWAATHAGGLFYFVPAQPYERSWQQLSMKQGLTTNNMYALTGNDSLLFVLSGKGIFVLNNRTGAFKEELNENKILSFSSFSSDEHLPHYTDYDNKRHELLVAAGGGLMLYKTAYTPANNDFPVVLSSLEVNNKPVTDSNWRYQNNSSFSYPLTTLQIGFAALEFAAPATTVFKYKLEGYDKNWKTATNINEVVYQHLPPGNYTFQLSATDFTGYTSASTASFSFVVIPPFWKTAWFRLLIILMTVCIIYLWISRLRRKIRTAQQLNTFATSLYGKNTVQEVLQEAAGNCVKQLGFSHCMVYQYDENKAELLPVSNQQNSDMTNSMDTYEGSLVLAAAKNLNPVKGINAAMAALAVPVLAEGKLYGVISAFHQKKNFFKAHHVHLLTKMAAVCGEKISRYIVEEKLRTKIARDLHDEMGSTLTSINIISKVAMAQHEKDEKLYAHLEKIKNNSSKMMDSMSDIVWAINPANDTFEKVALRMKEFAAEILEPAGINYYFRETGQMEKIVLNAEQRKDIYLIFKEALNNAVKYSGATEIDILLGKETDVVVMQIVDNGSGFDLQHHKQGNGLKNMQNRAQQMNAVLTIHPVKGTGTSVLLRAPVT